MRSSMLWGLGVLLLLGDLLSKWATVAYLPPMHLSAPIYPYGGVAVFENILGVEFSLSFTTNTGAAWGAFSAYQLPLLALRMALIALMGWYVAFRAQGLEVKLPLLLILVGAIGNVSDYFLYGHVIDMLHLVLWGYDFPVFNLADSYITLGVGAMVMGSFLEGSSSVKGAA